MSKEYIRTVRGKNKRIFSKYLEEDYLKTKRSIDEIDDIVKRFNPQHEPLQCLPTCLMNIHNELFKRVGMDHKISLSKAGEICGYRKGLGSNEHFLTEKINEVINEYNYIAMEEYSIKDEMLFLEKILIEEDLSFPIVTLDGAYLREIASIRGPSSRLFGHSVVVLGIDRENVFFYDPAENFITEPGPVSINPKKMLKPRFQELWKNYEEPDWILWYEPRKTRMLEEFLEEDDERKREYHIESY